MTEINKILFSKPWLLMPASLSHSLGPFLLRQSFWKKNSLPKNCAKDLLGLRFLSPFGTPGGLDKSAKDLETWQKLGAGFLEVGTFTPLAQSSNPGKILGRDVKAQALWNCMGFPNPGFEAVKPRIEKFKRKKSRPPLFINIGKNRSTKLEEAHKDYVKGIAFFKDLADAFVINISSPNTKDLRLLHKKETFLSFINPLINEKKKSHKKTPLFLKISPDLDQKDFEVFLEDLKELPDVEGLILTNTTIERPNEVSFPKRGGLSGKPLAKKSCEKLKLAKSILQEEKVLVSVGGILTPQEACQRLDFGADLVQSYSGLVYYGPNLLADSAKLMLKQA